LISALNSSRLGEEASRLNKHTSTVRVLLNGMLIPRASIVQAVYPNRCSCNLHSSERVARFHAGNILTLFESRLVHLIPFKQVCQSLMMSTVLRLQVNRLPKRLKGHL